LAPRPLTIDGAHAGGLPADVAIVHDYLNQRGGAERVVLQLAAMFPGAPVYTSLYRPDSTFPEFARLDVRTTFLDRIPVDRGFRALLPLYPAAFRSLGRIGGELLVSSSSGWAHYVRPAPGTFHAVYCYTPPRWLYGDYMPGSSAQRVLAPFAPALRRADLRAARRADLYIAISALVRDRIWQHYGRRAPVVYPPVDVDRFTPSPRGERLLVVSRLLAYKRVDLVVDAATRAGLGLDVVGTGPAQGDLRRRAGPSVHFHGRLSDAEITDLFQSCRTFCLPGSEDFGITPIEANAAGKPVVAFAGGGALETVEEGVSGTFFAEHSVDALLDALRGAEAITSSPQRIAELARRFSPQIFRERLTAVLVGAIGEGRS
jgi:glycosyltransferase involved in cell wall biosynthesis